MRFIISMFTYMFCEKGFNIYANSHSGLVINFVSECFEMCWSRVWCSLDLNTHFGHSMVLSIELFSVCGFHVVF